MRDLVVVQLPVDVIKGRDGNPRTHSPAQISRIASSIREFGFTNPILIDEANTVIAGHGRLSAAIKLSLEMVPTIQLVGLSEAQKRALLLADNKIAEQAGWDADLLRIEISAIIELDPTFDLGHTGFASAEIDIALAGPPARTGHDAADCLPPATPKPTSRRGDLWVLGPHRVLCADATEPQSYSTLMAGEAAQLVLTDPPYNVPIDGHVSGLGAARHPEFVMASGEMSPAAFEAFLRKICELLARNSVDGALHYIFMDWRHLLPLLRVGDGVYPELKNLCVWNKNNGGMGSFYRSKHELISVFKNGSAPHINNIELGRHGRNRTNVWDCAGASALGSGRAETLAMHPTVKPVQLLKDVILDASHRGGLVLDPFLGSGSTLIAAEQTGRRCFGLELAPAYVDTAVRRWEQLTGQTALLAEDGRSFAQVGEERTVSAPEGDRHAG